MPRRLTSFATALWTGFATPALAGSQAPRRDSAAVAAAERVTVTPSTTYRAGWLRRFILGTDYRALWSTPIEVDVLNLRAEAGGLRPTARGGSMQTNTLRFAGANGRDYVFRPVEKDFSKGLPPELRQTLVRDIAQDQVAGYHPAAALVVARLLDATGLHHPQPRLVLMPDDAALGEFRADFAGVLGDFEERPGTYFDETSESSGAVRTISSERLLERLRSNADNVVNVRALLAARLFDILVGDRDRHRDQWRWGRFSDDEDAPWEPIPRDRDMPFAKFEGLGPSLIRVAVPQFVSFTSRYPDMVWLNWNAREIDRRLLVPLTWPVWDSVTTELQHQISDAVIDSAIARMPPPFVLENGRQLRDMIVARRQRLPVASRAYYRVLAREVDLNATDDPDLAEVTRMGDGSVSVTIARWNPSKPRRDGDRPYFQRAFQPAETREIRIYLLGGNDHVVVRGAPTRDILIRVIGGDGDDTVADSVAGDDRASRFHDAVGDNAVSGPGQIATDAKPYAPRVTRPEAPLRDWGTWASTLGALSVAPGLGLLVSLDHRRNGYGFRSDPFATHLAIRADLSLGELRPRLTLDAAFRAPNSQSLKTLRLTASGLELIRFHGQGNETTSDRGTSYYRVFQNLFRAEPAWTTALSHHATMSLGAIGQYTATRDDTHTQVGDTRPYGSGGFGEVGARIGLDIDQRDTASAPRRGFRLRAGGTVYPSLWSVAHPFGEANVTASTYWSTTSVAGPVLALRAGAQHVWGAFPFHDAAHLGGLSSIRGWDEQRFAGRSALFGNAEVRAFLKKIIVIAPTDLGILAFADAGRVYADGETSHAWHTALGGGIWLAPLMRSNTVSISVAHGRERTGFYLRTGFAF